MKLYLSYENIHHTYFSNAILKSCIVFILTIHCLITISEADLIDQSYGGISQTPSLHFFKIKNIDSIEAPFVILSFNKSVSPKIKIGDSLERYEFSMLSIGGGSISKYSRGSLELGLSSHTHIRSKETIMNNSVLTSETLNGLIIPSLTLTLGASLPYIISPIASFGTTIGFWIEKNVNKTTKIVSIHGNMWIAVFPEVGISMRFNRIFCLEFIGRRYINILSVNMPKTVYNYFTLGSSFALFLTN